MNGLPVAASGHGPMAWPALILALLLATPAWADVYRWVDKDGVVHYSDKPPESVEPESLQRLPETGPPSANIGAQVYDDAMEQTRARREQREAEKQLSRAEREAREKDEANRAELCARAIHHLNILRKACPAFYDGAGVLRDQCPGFNFVWEGERSYIDDEERAELIEQYSKVAESCREARD